MSDLANYVREHTDGNECSCCHDSQTPLAGSVDVFFFDVCAKNNPDADTLKKLIAAHSGEFGPCDPLDGNEHSYIEVGGWIGDQGMALRLMGLGVILGLWQVIHPVNMLKLERTDPLAQQMAGIGMVSIMKDGSRR